MTQSLRNTVRHAILSRSSDSDKQPSKSTVIAIAVVATVLVLALIAVGIFFFLRKRARKAKGTKNKHHGKVVSSDRGVDSLNDPISKTPLMRQDDQSQVNDYRGSPVPRYDEENDIDTTAPQTLRRSFSGVSMQSLPPSYSAAMHEPNDESSDPVSRAVSRSRHSPTSSNGGSDGLRPLMLVNAQQGHNDDQDITEGRGRAEHLAKTDGSHLIPARPSGRPRAGSRFREEDLDM